MSRRRPVVLVLCLLAAVAGASGVLGGATEPHHDAVASGATGEAVVTRVVDGDTAILSTLGRSRFIGVDTPVLWSRRVIPSTAAPAKR